MLLQRLHGCDDVAQKIASHHCLCEVVDLAQLSKLGHSICPDLLDCTITARRGSHALAYGNALTYLKGHLTSHLPDCMRARLEKNNLAILIACWCLDLVSINAYI